MESAEEAHYGAKFGLSHDGSNLSALPNYDTKDLPAHEREMYQIILREMKDERVKEFLTEKEKVREQTMLMHESLIVDLNSLVEEGDTGAEDSWCHMVSGDGVKEDAVAEGNTSGAEGESSLVRKQPKKTQKQLSQVTPIASRYSPQSNSFCNEVHHHLEVGSVGLHVGSHRQGAVGHSSPRSEDGRREADPHGKAEV